MIRLTDPTLAGTKDPARKIARLQDRIQHLRLEQEAREDQIHIMEHEIQLLQASLP